MFSKKENILALAGGLAFVFAILLVFVPSEEGAKVTQSDWHSPLGIVVIVIGVVAIVFYGWGLLKKDRHLSRNDMNAIVEERKKHLPELKSLIEHKLTRQQQLAEEAKKLPLTEYRDRYLKHTFAYRVGTHRHGDPRWIVETLRNHSFYRDNLYYSDLKSKDGELDGIEKRYQIALSMAADKSLERFLKVTWYSEHIVTSLKIMTVISSNPDVPNTPTSRRLIRVPSKISEAGFASELKAVIERIDCLMNGDDL